ncbi:MAG: hypothetical protein HXN09_02070 [Porphyromonadaceae bacterium]|nr:hypothetical protein [Porphyromonadaceae bacterium]
MQNNDKTQKNLSGLHNTLETMGYSVPNIDQFAKDMRKEENLRSVYDKVSSGGYELPDFETFKADMGWIKPTPAGVPTPLRPKDQLAPTGKPDAPATPFGFDLSANPKKPSHAPKARLGFPRLDKKMRPVQEVNDPSVPLLKTTRDVAQDENGNVVNVVQPELVPDFDPNNGGVTAPKALLDVTTGKAIRPSELSKEEVDGYNAGNIDAVKDPKLRQALKEANIIYTPTLTESDARRKAGELTSEIDKALAERTEYLDKKAGDVTIADSPTAWGIRGFNIPAAANKSRIEQATDSEYMMLEAARSTMHDVNNLIAEADHNTKEGGDLASIYERSALAGTLRGFGSTIIDPRVWDQGARDLSASSRLALALDKADRGEKLTRGEQLLLDAKANEMATALYFEDRIGRGYKAGSVTAHAIPFMVEMAMSGGISTMGKNVSSGLARYAMRRFGAKAAGKAIIKRTIRGAATTAGAMLAGGAMANTFGAMKTAANVVGRTTGDVQFATGVDAEGRATTTYGGHTEGDSLGEAFVKGELSNTSEYATELLGDGLVDAVKWAAGKVASPVASKLAQLIGKTGVEAAEQVGKKSVLGKVVGSVGDAGVWTLSKASKFIENMQASKFATSLKALEKQAQWNGVFGEYLEELANNAAAVMIGDKDLSADKGKGFFNLDDNIDTFLGVSLMGGVMSGAQTAGYFAGGGARGMARYQIGQSEGAVWSTLTTDEQRKAWDDVRRQILLQDGKEQVDAVKSALTNPNFNAEQRRAILDYTKSVQTYKGMSEYRRKQSEDTKADPLQNELADSYDKGAEMTQAEEMSHARSWYEFAQQKAAERLGVDAEALDEMEAPDQLTLDQVAQLREEHNEQAVQSYVDYLNARATYEGMIGSVSQGIQAEAAQAEQAVRSQQHKDGTLRRATLRGTEGQNVEVHIKDGDLVMDEEGRIDTDKSSKDFIVRDDETGVVRFASIDDIISAEQPTNADDAVNEAVNVVYERREKEAADAINGTVTPQVGAVYDLLDADGNPQQIAIQQVGQDGTLDVDYSGVPHRMTTDELQSMADNTRARQIENEHAAQVQQAKAEEREEREQVGLPRYALNDELTIRTPEGEEVTAYVTNEEDADGNIEVYFNEPFDGKKVHLFTKDYLDGVVVGTRLSPETNTSAGAVEAPATPAAPALAQAQPVSEEVPEEATTAPTPTQEEENDIIGRSMTEEEAEAFLTAISNNHEVAPELELTPENWYAEFGEDGMVHTPIGDAHMGENQFLKMMRDGRKSKLGMIRPTLEAPHAIVEEPSMAKEGQETERDSSYIYIRVFEKEDGSRHYHFTSVSVLRDGGEVVVSNQEKSRNQVKRLLTEGVVLWMRADNAPDTSDVDQDLYSSQGTELSDPASEGTDASQSTPSEGKDNESASHADPNDESLSPEEAYEAVLHAANGDASLALEVIKSTITDKEKALTKAKKAKPRSANTIDGKIQALAEVASGIEAAETSLAHWQAVAEIAAEQVQEEVTEVAEPVAEQTEQEAEEPTTEPAPAEEETVEEQEPEAEQEQEEEATTIPEDTAPEWSKDNPADARARGYIKVEGLRVERQGQLSDALIGKESDVKFATNDTQQARYAIIEAESLQPSHIRGYQNQLHFIPEAQPKDRSDVVSEQAAVRIAANINPEEITTSATAYTGAPTINARGEVIQGNSRADALRAVWESFRDSSGAKYKQYLIDNAEDLGIDPEAIEGMKSPVLVHLADVSDERAIELGQYRQADIESGGVERINPQTLYAKIGEKRDTFIRFLLGASDDDLSLAESITRNAAETLSWLNRQGFISDTQFRSAFGSKGEITAEAKEDLRNALYRSFFEGAHNSLEAEFYNLPKRTQQALLRVSYRDQQSPADAHFLDELQSSVSAYNALMGYTPFAEAKTFEDAERAIETWMRFSGDLITGEVNSEQYSNFAMQLALRYKFYTQKELIAKLNAVYDAVQAVSEDTLFGEGEVNPKTLAEAVSEVFSIKYDNKTEEDGSIGSSSPGSDLEGSNGGEQEGQGTPGGNEQDQSRAGTPERRGGAASDPQEGEGVTTQTEEVAPEAGDTQASDTPGEGYRLSAIAAKRGGNFFENNEGSIDLVKISDNVFEAIGIKPLPMRMTEAMAQHIIKQHAKELGISTQEEAVAFVVDIMQHFDHVREGNKPNTYIFSIEKGRSRTGKRAVTLVLPSKSGEYLGVSSSGYEKVSRLKERALLWEEGANNEAPTTETASANVTSPSATQGGMTGGSASNQSNALSQGKDSEKEIAEGEANDGNQDDLSIEEKEALLSKAKQELEEKENERTAVAEQAIAIMKDYYDSGAIPGMDSGEFHGQATLILIGFKDRSNLELMKAPGLSELLPSLYKLADEARAKKVLVRKYEKELSQAKEVEGETLTHDKAIRDELVNTMRDAGIEVITDEAEGQAVLDAVHAGEAQMQRAYHGTDADFEAFDHSHMGEGAGGQAYGWGSYFTEEEGVARSYAGGGFVYEAELPDDTGSNYLHFESKPSNKDIARVKRELVEYILRNDEEGMYDYPQGKDDLTQEVDDAGEPTTWRDLYGTVSSHLGSDKEASAFFHSIGYVGIQYNSSETDGGKKNLVIFDESDISIQSKVRLFKTTSGEVYGFVKDGKIYLDLKHATAETAIHEYTHLWASALRRVNPRAWKSIRKQLKGFELWADVASRYPELKGDEDALADEVLAQYSGKRGTQRIEEEMKKADNATDLVGKARVLAAFNSLKEALKTFWTEVADFFGMDYYKSVEDAADKAMSDLLRGVNPNAVEAKEETTKKKPTKKSTAKKETATSSVIAPDSERYNGYIVTLPKSGKAGAEVGNIEEFVGADEAREGLMVVYQAPEGFAVASNGTMAIADKTQFDVYKKGKAYKLDGTTIDAGAWKPLKDKWQSFISMETRGENSDPFTESPVNITRLSKYLDRVEQDLYNRWKYAKSEGLTKDSFKTYRSRAMVSIPNGRGGYVRYRYPEMRSMTLAAKRLGVTSFFVEGDIHYESSVYPGVRLVGNGRLGSVVHAGTAFRHDAPKPSESELSYLYDEAVGVKDADQGVRMQKGDEGLSLQETSDAINARFNEELKEQIEGTLPQDHIYTLGLPGKILRSTGIPNLPIEMSASRANLKSNQENHPFSLEVLEDLPKMLQHPIAVFSYGDKRKAQNVIVEVEHQGQNLLVGLSLNQEKDGIEVNSIRGLFPKYTHGWLLWIQQGKALYLNKEAIQDKIEQWRTNLANVPYLNLDSITKVVETFDNPPLASEDLEISNDNQASEDNDKEVRYRSDEEVEQDDLDMQDLEEVATSMAEVLGEDVRVIHDTAEIEGRNESETNRMRGAKGWYDPKTGQVVVVLPNAESADDVEATILHEVVGHKGLQELVGKDQFGKFLDEVFEGANEAVRNGIVERSKRYGWNTRLATEEYIAELAEQGFKDLEARDLWHVVRNAFYNLLSRVKLALGWDISDRELRYMLWRTYQMKKGEGLMGQAKDIAMQEKLGVGNYEEARFRQGEIAPVKVAATYDALIKKSSYQTQEALQDSMLSLKKVMEMIMQAKGDAKYIEEIEGYQNAYMGENRVSSVNQAEAAAYSRMALEPLVEEVSRLAKKAHHSYVTDYMMAKHGLERNRVMAFQKAVEADVDAHNKAVKESGEGEELTASSLWDAYLNDTDRLRNEADYREGRITADVWHKTDDEIRARYAPSYAEYRERDYAGLTGLLDRPDVDIQTLEEEAIEEVMKFEQENDVTDLWDLTNKATDAPLSKQYEGGLMSRETLEHVRNMYGYYIPLRGFDETTSDEAYSYLGDRDRAFSPTLKKAKGRSSKAEDPLAHIASMMESAILQSNRNKLVRQKFLNFVENNPSDLFSVQKLWVKWNEVTKAWEAVLPEFDPNDTSEEVIRKTQEFEEMMQENKRKDPKNFKLASEQPSIPYRVVSLGEQMQHQIIVKRGGRDVVIIVNGDPRVAMAVNGQTNPDGEAKGHIGALFRAGAAVNRKLAGFYTSLSPNFVVKNFIRDIIYANTIAWVKESPTYAMTYHANVAKLAGQMHRLVHLYEHDKLDMSNETHRAFKLFMENGGETGYSQLRSMDRHKKEIERMMKESGGRISPKQAFRLLGDTMEFANRGIEDLSRFAAFLTSRQMGRTIDRSIYDAKEMTVNFNKKGAGSTFYDATTQSRVGNAAALLSGTGRSLYLFWNVAIQGSVNIARAVKRNPKKGTAYLATFLALGILQTMLPALTGGDDDDRYWNLPDYVRRNNICFFVGDVLVKIPLPQEARAIFGIGELGMSYSSGKEDKTPMELAQTIAGQISQVMPLDLMDDSGATHALMPSLAKPFFEAQTNHSWMGRPIWKDTDYNKAMPDWTKAYKATGGAYVWLAKELNALTGGDDYKQGWVNINPAKLEYMLKGYLGGLYTAADQIIKSSETAFGDREFSMRDVPILSGFLDGADERNDMRNVNNTYYHFKEEAKEVLRLGKSYERDAEQGKGDYAKKLDELVNDKSYERALLFEDLSKEIEEMQKALKEATDPKEAEELQAEIDKQKKALVNQLRQMK